jgi:hypothetical protein
MADLNTLAKRIHNASPDPIRVTLDDGTEAVLRMESTEFFQQEFQAEGTREEIDPRRSTARWQRGLGDDRRGGGGRTRR